MRTRYFSLLCILVYVITQCNTDDQVRTAYKQLTKWEEKASVFKSINALLGWDQQVLMPPMGAKIRGMQEVAISGVLHDLKTQPQINS
jgi:Zn-dependent M32 family carboxypeptidase